MADSRLSLDVNHDSLDRATDALSEADDELAVEIPDEMVQLAEKLAEIARLRVLAEPVHGLKQRGLRPALASGVDVTPNDNGGADITASLDGWTGQDSSDLPADTDRGLIGWVHPVFGHEDRWVHQDDSFSWFTDSMDSAEDDGREALQRLLDDAAQKISDSVGA